VTEQLAFDLETACARLADGLRDTRRVPTRGAERLVMALVRKGLDERALGPAAALALELDEPRGASS
jgi:hypothetical protein